MPIIKKDTRSYETSGVFLYPFLTMAAPTHAARLS
jgi:hypothetical protein